MRLAVTGNIDNAVFDLLLGQCGSCLSGKDKRLDLDLSSAGFGTPSGLVPFAGLLRLLRSRDVEVTVSEYPKNPSTCSYYCRMDFFRRIGARTVCQHPQRMDGEGRFIEITELRHPEITDEMNRKLKRLLQRLPKGVEATEESRSSFIDSSGELLSNTRHAYNLALEPGVRARPRACSRRSFILSPKP